MKKITPKAKKIIKKVRKCAESVFNELGQGWTESVYQKAMEVALREAGIDYEDQRILPISYNGHVVGEGIPDLVVWTTIGRKRQKVAIVIDLKWTRSVKETHREQVAKYIRELKKQVKKGRKVLDTGFVINFTKESSEKIEEFEETEGIQVLEVKA